MTEGSRSVSEYTGEEAVVGSIEQVPVETTVLDVTTKSSSDIQTAVGSAPMEMDLLAVLAAPATSIVLDQDDKAVIAFGNNKAV